MGIIDRRMEEEARSILHANERLLMKIRQRKYSNLTPSFVLVTNRRLIIVNNSFWGLYTGYNLFSPTNYNSIAYNQITSVILIKGNALCSVAIRLHGYFEKNIASQQSNEGQIDGLSLHDASQLTNLIDHMIEGHELKNESIMSSMNMNPAPSEYDRLAKRAEDHLRYAHINLEFGDALAVVRENNSRFIWLGSEPANQLAGMLNTDGKYLIKLPAEEIMELDEADLKRFDNCVLVGYDDRLATRLANYLAKAHNLSIYSLKGGITARLKLSR
jgi:hypothetical protein